MPCLLIQLYVNNRHVHTAIDFNSISIRFFSLFFLVLSCTSCTRAICALHYYCFGSLKCSNNMHLFFLWNNGTHNYKTQAYIIVCFFVRIVVIAHKKYIVEL